MLKILSKLNFYLTIILAVSILSVRLGNTSKYINDHIYIMLVLDAIYFVISSVLLSAIFMWCYKNERPQFAFKYYKSREKNKLKRKFDDIYKQTNTTNDDLLKIQIDNASFELKNNKKGSGHRALQQFLEWINKDRETQIYIYKEIRESLKYIRDDELLKEAISVICIYNKNLNMNLR